MVTQIVLYPIKGLDGIAVDSARVLGSGALEFDRRWVLVDARGRFVNGKNRSEAHSIRAEYELARREVTLDGRTLPIADTAAWFSERLGESVELRENADAGFPDDTDSPGPTFVSTPSIERVASWFNLSLDETRRRFRCNIEFDAPEPFWEDRLYGSRFSVGEVVFQAVNPCQRCIVPSRDSRTGAQEAGFQKRFADLREAEFPPSAPRGQFTHYYRFTVNTRVAAGAGKILRIGDGVTFPEATRA